MEWVSMIIKNHQWVTYCASSGVGIRRTRTDLAALASRTEPY